MGELRAERALLRWMGGLLLGAVMAPVWAQPGPEVALVVSAPRTAEDRERMRAVLERISRENSDPRLLIYFHPLRRVQLQAASETAAQQRLRENDLATDSCFLLKVREMSERCMR